MTSEWLFKAKIVYLVLSTDTEKAIELASQHYGISKPIVKIGMPKRYSRKLACYLAKKQTICVSHRKILNNPYVILHEFYHHLRNVTSTQKGLEKHADRFAADYLKAYKVFELHYEEGARDIDSQSKSA